MKNYYKPGFFVLLALLLIGAVGDTYRSVMVDSGGLIQNDPISKTNNISIYTAPSSAFHLIRYADMTNTVLFPLPVSRGGTGTNTTMLPGNWTNSLNFTVGSNLVVNADQWTASGVPLTVYGSDGILSLVPASSSPHARLSMAFYTNNEATVAGWTIGQDPDAGHVHKFSIFDFINSSSRMLITSNASIAFTTISTTISSNLVVSGNVTTSVTNDARFYRVNAIPGFTGSVTNLGPALGSSNVLAYASGIVTNYYKIP